MHIVMTDGKRKNKLLILMLQIIVLIIVIIVAIHLLKNMSVQAYNSSTKNNGNIENITDNGNHNEPEQISLMNGETKEPTEKVKDAAISRYIFVGDSRYVGMRKFAQSNDIFIAENAQGYDFLMSKLETIRQYADNNSVLIIGLGVNDYGVNYKKYISIMNELADTLECNVYYMLINPVEEEKEIPYGYTVYNEMIDKYNMLMRAGFSDRVKIIDSNTYLKENGFSTVDGLHYDDNTYNKIYNYLKSNAL